MLALPGKRMLVLTFVVLATSAYAQDWPSNSQIREYLSELLNAQPDRDLGRTSEVEWTISWNTKWDAGLIERHVTRTTGDTVWQSNLGDSNGFHRTTFSRRPPRDATPEEAKPFMTPRHRKAGTNNTLILDGRVWHLDGAEKPISGDVFPIDSPRATNLPLDFSTIGIAVSADVHRNMLGLFPPYLEGIEGASLESYHERGLDVVVAEFNERRIEWYLDPRQDGLPVEAILLHNDRFVARSETDYEEMEGRRFPSTVRFYTGWDAAPSRVIQIRKATFDKPWHMHEITPEDIGVLYGTQLFSSEDNGRYLRWDGTRLLTSSEYHDLVDLYGVRPSLKIIELLARPTMTPAEYIAWMDRTMEWRREEYFAEHGTRPWLEEVVLFKRPEEKDEWDVYVEKFIEKHKLTGEPLERAKDILQRSKKMRDARLRKNAVEIRKAQREGDKKKLAHYEGITRRIFDEVLVRTLNRLVPKSPTEPAPGMAPEVGEKR